MARGRMIPAPAFRFYPKDWRTSETVLAMNHTARGIYIDLLCQCWLEGSLPDNPEVLARAIGCSRTQFDAEFVQVKRAFKSCRGRLYNRRLEKERDKQRTYRELQAEKGRASAQARLNRGSHLVEPTPQPEGNSSFSFSSSSSVRTKHTSADADFEIFRQAYPVKGRVGGPKAKSAFAKARQMATSEQLLAALEQHTHSEQWRDPKFIPGMLVWLHQERWRQTLPEAKPKVGESAYYASNWQAECRHEPKCRSPQWHQVQLAKDAMKGA